MTLFAEREDASGSRRERNKARTRAAILDASLTHFTEAGVQGTTMDQIAAAADVARATLFKYFPSKSDIIDALVAESDRGFFISMEAWRGVAHLSTGERLLGLFAATAYYLRRAPARKRALIGLSWMNWSEAASVARTRRVSAAFATLLEDGRAAGDVPDTLDFTLAADIIGDNYMGLVRRWWLDESFPTAERLDGAARLLVQMIMPGTRLPDTPPLPPKSITQDNYGL